MNQSNLDTSIVSQMKLSPRAAAALAKKQNMANVAVVQRNQSASRPNNAVHEQLYMTAAADMAMRQSTASSGLAF